MEGYTLSEKARLVWKFLNRISCFEIAQLFLQKCPFLSAEYVAFEEQQLLLVGRRLTDRVEHESLDSILDDYCKLKTHGKCDVSRPISDSGSQDYFCSPKSSSLQSSVNKIKSEFKDQSDCIDTHDNNTNSVTTSVSTNVNSNLSTSLTNNSFTQTCSYNAVLNSNNQQISNIKNNTVSNFVVTGESTSSSVVLPFVASQNLSSTMYFVPNDPLQLPVMTNDSQAILIAEGYENLSQNINLQSTNVQLPCQITNGQNSTNFQQSHVNPVFSVASGQTFPALTGTVANSVNSIVMMPSPCKLSPSTNRNIQLPVSSHKSDSSIVFSPGSNTSNSLLGNTYAPILPKQFGEENQYIYKRKRYKRKLSDVKQNQSESATILEPKAKRGRPYKQKPCLPKKNIHQPCIISKKVKPARQFLSKEFIEEDSSDDSQLPVCDSVDKESESEVKTPINYFFTKSSDTQSPPLQLLIASAWSVFSGGKTKIQQSHVCNLDFTPPENSSDVESHESYSDGIAKCIPLSPKDSPNVASVKSENLKINSPSVDHVNERSSPNIRCANNASSNSCTPLKSNLHSSGIPLPLHKRICTPHKNDPSSENGSTQFCAAEACTNKKKLQLADVSGNLIEKTADCNEVRNIHENVQSFCEDVISPVKSRTESQEVKNSNLKNDEFSRKNLNFVKSNKKLTKGHNFDKGKKKSPAKISPTKSAKKVKGKPNKRTKKSSNKEVCSVKCKKAPKKRRNSHSSTVSEKDAFSENCMIKSKEALVLDLTEKRKELLRNKLMPVKNNEKETYVEDINSKDISEKEVSPPNEEAVLDDSRKRCTEKNMSPVKIDDLKEIQDLDSNVDGSFKEDRPFNELLDERLNRECKTNELANSKETFSPASVNHDEIHKDLQESGSSGSKKSEITNERHYVDENQFDSIKSSEKNHVRIVHLFSQNSHVSTKQGKIENDLNIPLGVKLPKIIL